MSPSRIEAGWMRDGRELGLEAVESPRLEALEKGTLRFYCNLLVSFISRRMRRLTFIL